MNKRFLVPVPREVNITGGSHLLSTESVFAAPEKFRDTVLATAEKYWKVTPVFIPLAENLSGDDGYRVEIDSDRISFHVNSRHDLLNAFKTLRQWAEAEKNQIVSEKWVLNCGSFADTPGLEFRGIHLCYFRETEDWELEKLLRLAAYYKFNYAVIEFWGTFPFEKYPEFQWAEKHGNREFIRHLIKLGEELDIKLIPQYNCFGHAAGSSVSNGRHVVLDRFPQFAPLFEPDGWTWCLANPKVQEVQKELLEEIFELFGDVPFFHLGFDEAFNAGSCLQCSQRDYPQLIKEHILFLHGVLAAHDCRAILWHDMFLELDEKRWKHHILVDRNAPNPYRILDELPRDIILADWHYGKPEADENGVYWPTADYFAGKGFQVLLAPCVNEQGILTMAEHAANHHLAGMLETTWVAVSGTSRLRQIFFVTANKMWNHHWMPEKGFADEFNVVNTHLRHIGHDMNFSDPEHFGSIYTGYSFFP
ncbi:MAG: family 20 glycosylhydrolase [Lentisphaeria bacterium]|nr:family 20 glycosylhydrolase [Lentisphaeria bacterium]